MYKELIDSYLDGKLDEMIEDVKRLVRINSHRGESKPGMPFGEGPAAVLDEALSMMEGYGLKTTDYDHYVVTGDFGPSDKALDILAHLDVVPVTEDWTVTQPFDPVVVDGKLYGRGTMDDKGPAVAALYAIRAVMDLGLPIKRGVRLILGSDEECGSSDLPVYYSKEEEAPYTFTPDGEFPVINLEKARLAKKVTANVPMTDKLPRICSMHAGSEVNVVPGAAQITVEGISAEALRAAADAVSSFTKAAYTVTEAEDGSGMFLVTCKGSAAHASTPEMGNNALTAMLELIAALNLAASPARDALLALGKLFPHGETRGESLGIAMKDEISGELTISLDILHYDGAELTAQFDSRDPVCATDENLTEVLRTVFAEHGLTMEEGSLKPAHYVPADSPFIQLLLESYERYFGVRGEPLAIGGGTYVHELQRGVAFGCMTDDIDNHMHGDDEFMTLDQLLTSAKIFADVIVKLCC